MTAHICIPRQLARQTRGRIMSFPIFRLEDSPGWKRKREERLFDHRYIQVDEVDYETPTQDQEVTWIVSRRKSAVVVAPQLEDGRFLMIRQERYPIQREIWEFPAGQIDDFENRDDPEVILATAERELREETAHRLMDGGEMRSLGYFFSSQGFTDEHAYLFLAKGVESTGEGLELDRFENILACEPFTINEIRERIAENEIIDANTLAVFARLCALGLIE